MNAELTELIFILDRSGSMGGLEADTIKGFNHMIAQQKEQGKKVNVTTILFDDEVDIIYITTPHNTHYKFMKKRGKPIGFRVEIE